jgi:5-methylcytosine-specific restriction endonuclease McrA
VSAGRRAVPKAADRRKLKARLAARDGMACFYCGTEFGSLADATLDHLVPYSEVPGWRQANLVLACLPCNVAKADQLPQAFLRPVGYGPGLVPLHAGTQLDLASAA